MSGEVPVVVVQAGRRDGRLSLDEEFRDIEQMLRATPYGSALRLRPLLAARFEDLRTALYDKPVVLQLRRARQSRGRFPVPYRRRRPGTSEHWPPVRADGRAGTHDLTSAGQRVLGVELARQASQHFGCAVGMSGLIDDTTARQFSKGFYEAIGQGRSVGNAFRVARLSLATYELSDHDAPTLFERTEGRADALYLIPARLMTSPPRDPHKPGAGVPWSLPRQRKFGAFVTGVAGDEQELRTRASQAGLAIEMMITFDDQ